MELFLHGEYRDPYRAGRSLINKAAAHIENGDPESAVQALKQASSLIDPDREPRLILCIRHNPVDNLSKMGRHKGSGRPPPAAPGAGCSARGAPDRLRLSWVEGRVAAGLGEQERARQLLGSVRQAFLDDANPFEAALATLDQVVSILSF